ncbi:hypothetical protein, partial [Komagataeibacter oboediens]|uniref:hypothetical protein n=1 Tax=Komagataeibacter oboediens TaxID=65958 RepID=UPI001F39D275
PRVVDDCPYPQSSAKNQSNRFLIQALTEMAARKAMPDNPALSVMVAAMPVRAACMQGASRAQS